MQCDHQIGDLLPWFLNGTLEPEQRREIQERLRTCAACRDLLQETMLAWRVYNPEVSADTLIRFAWHEPLTPEEREQLIPQWCLPEEEQSLMALAGQSYQALLNDEEPAAKDVPFGMRSVGQGRRHWAVLSLAAALLFACLGWYQTHREAHQNQSDLKGDLAKNEADLSRLADELEVLKQPAVNLLVLDLFPGDLRRRGQAEPINLMPRQVNSVVALLSYAGPTNFDRFQIEWLNADEQRIWFSDQLQLSPEGGFTVRLPLDVSSANGSLRITGMRGEDQTVVARYWLVTEEP